VYEHVVTFDDTNVVGNVYFVSHLRWQGRCRELFLERHTPGLLDELGRGLVLVTTSCSCDYFDELVAFDHVSVAMSLGEVRAGRVVMLFDYRRDGRDLVARGRQEIACLRRDGDRLVPVEVPDLLLDALRPYAAVDAQGTWT
jgi:enediyne biosynthesis thioesterase